MRSLSLGYSPCPNDTFIFYALIHGKIDTGKLAFKELLLDVETLNQKALSAELDITKVSFHAYGHLRDKYVLLRSGSALGRGCGPLVVAKHAFSISDLRNKRIAIPGRLTTAFLLLQLYDPAFFSLNSKLKTHNSVFVPMPFDRIMDAVASDEVDAGLIIHESRFTYPSYGLKQVMDLGEWWEKETGLPIPLGGILARRTLGNDLITQVDAYIRSSIQHALAHRAEPMEYIRKHSQELSDDVINQHINLYVNDYSVDIGDEGERAVKEFLSRAEDARSIPK